MIAIGLCAMLAIKSKFRRGEVMAKLDDLFGLRGHFKPQPPTRETEICKCPECGKSAPFSEWTFHNGLDSGSWCEDCEDFHACFECPNCGEQIGIATSWLSIQVEVK